MKNITNKLRDKVWNQASKNLQKKILDNIWYIIEERTVYFIEYQCFEIQRQVDSYMWRRLDEKLD